MRIEIDRYRGWIIYFDPENEMFFGEGLEAEPVQKTSFSAAKKAIDDYLKDNSNFKPFKVVKVGWEVTDPITITGVRKDGKFIYEEDGKKKQISTYDEQYYYLWKDFPEDFKETLEELQGYESKAAKAVRKHKETIKGLPTLKTMRDEA